MTTTGPVPAAVRVFLLDGHRVFAESLALALDSDQGMRCVAAAHSVHDGLRTADRLDFDVALVDLRLPDGDGLAAIPELLARRPRAAVVVLTAHTRADLVRRAIAAGAVGFLGKNASLAEVTDAVRAASNGRRVLGPDLDPDPADQPRMTPREHDVLLALGRGLDATRIAGALGISLHTTRDHIRSVMGKLGVRTQLDAVVTAQRLGLVDLPGTF